MQTNWWFPASTFHRIFKIQDALNLENSTKLCRVFITWWIQTCSSFESHVNLINSHRCRFRPRSWWGRPALCTRALMPDWVKMKWVCRGGECHQRPEEHAPIKLAQQNSEIYGHNQKRLEKSEEKLLLYCEAWRQQTWWKLYVAHYQKTLLGCQTSARPSGAISGGPPVSVFWPQFESFSGRKRGVRKYRAIHSCYKNLSLMLKGQCPVWTPEGGYTYKHDPRSRMCL